MALVRQSVLIAMVILSVLPLPVEAVSAPRVDPAALAAWKSQEIEDALTTLRSYASDPKNETDVANMVFLLDVLVCLDRTDPVDDLHVADTAVELAGSFTEPTLLIDALVARSRLLTRLNRDAASKADLRRVEALAENGSSDSIALALVLRAQHESDENNIEAAADTLTAALAMIDGLTERTSRSVFVYNEAAAILAQFGDYARAAETSKKAYDLAHAVFGDHHPMTLDPTIRRVLGLTAVGEFEAARDLVPNALETAETHFGSNHRLTVELLLSAAKTEALADEHQAAKPLIEATIERARTALGPQHGLTLDAMSVYASVLYELGEYPAARALHEETIGLYRSQPGGETSFILPLLNSYAGLLEEMHLYEEAGNAYDDAIRVAEKTTDPDGFQVGTLKLNSAPSVLRGGDTAGAFRRLEEGIRILSKHLPEGNPNWAIISNLQADLYREAGDFAAAIEAYRRTLTLVADRPGSVTEIVALSNLSNLFAWIGTDWKAPTERAIALAEGTLGPAHPNTLILLWNLVDELIQDKDAEGAAVTLSLIDKRLEGHTEDYAHVVVGVEKSRGDLAQLAGQHGAAISAYDRALRLAEAEVEGSVLPADLFIQRALSESALGRSGQAEQTLLRALAAAEKRGEAGSLEVAKAKSLLAIHALRAGSGRDALVYATESAASLRRRFEYTVDVLTERQALTLAPINERNVGVLSALALSSDEQVRDRAAQAAWNEVILSRAAVQKAIARRYQRLRDSPDEEIQQATTTLMNARRRLAHLLIGDPDLEPAQVARQLDSSRAEVSRKEAELASVARQSAVGPPPPPPVAGDIVAAIPADTTLVSFARIPVATEALHRDSPKRYVAFVLRNRKTIPTLIDLGPAEKIDRLVQDWRIYAKRPPKKLRANATKVEQHGKTLRLTVWDRLRPHFGDAKTIFLVPDGSLNFIPFAALPRDRGGFLIEDPLAIHTLNSERDLIEFQVKAKTKPSDVLLVGDPAFGKTPDDYTTIAENRGFTAECDSFETLTFGRLAMTAAEIDTIASMIGGEKSIKLTKDKATEAAFRKHASQVQLIHIATHGFSLGRSCATDADYLEPGAPIRPLADDALQGLAFSGANRLADATGDDGLLTAEEIARMDLSSSQWVVLSACDTGLGIVQVGEGVLGLRRAFATAGARTVIMSLWKVADSETREWMTTLYGHRLEGRNTVDSVRDASLNRLQARRKLGLSDHPYYWAGFVAVGDWN